MKPAGLGPLTKLALRRDRRPLLVTVVGFVLTLAASARAISVSLGDLSERRELAGTLGQNPAFLLLLGPFDHPDTIASSAAWRIGLFMMTVLGVLVAMTVVRHTRKQEEAGLHELVGAARTDRVAPLLAGVLSALALTIVVAVAVAVLAISIGSGVVAALAYAAQYVGVGVATVGTTALLVQVATASRTANGLSIGVVLLGYALRGLADARDQVDWLRWLTPIGWAQDMDPYGHRSWWPLAWCSLLAIAGLAAAAVVREHRDLGAGLIRPRPGRSRARFLTSEFTLAWRLESRSLSAWAVGLLLYAAVIRSVRADLSELDAASSQIGDVLARLGGFDAAMAGIVGIIVAAWALTVVGMLRADEHSGRSELMLSTKASRPRLLLANLGVVLVGSVALMVLIGLFAGSVRAQLVQLPAVWVTAGLAIALHGIGPRWVPLAWVVIAWSFFVGQIGVLLSLPGWLQQLAPFNAVPKVPAEPWSWPPLLWLTAIAAAFVALGITLLQRRDLPA